MAAKSLIYICVYAFLIKTITSQFLSNAEIMAPTLLPDGIGLVDALPLGPTLAANNLPIGSNMPINTMAIGPNTVMPLGSNLANNLALGSNWPLGQGSTRLGFPGMGPISPAAMAPPMGIAASNGGGFTVTSSSPVAPTGLTVTSENAIEGTLIVSGQLPFLGSVGMDGSFSTAGGGTVSYGCGNGNIGMVNEGLSSSNVAPTLAPTHGYGSGIPGGQFNSLSARGFGGLY